MNDEYDPIPGGGDGWLAVLAAELRGRGVDHEQIRHVVAETAAHLRDSGEPPASAFGRPAAYAAVIADSLGAGPWQASARPLWRAPGAVRLEARGIAKRYRGTPVLRGVDLTVRAGQVAAVVGANGCGKSTFLRICAGLAGPDEGTVRVRGTLGYCPQDGGTCEYLDADEHFVLIGAGRGLGRGAARAAGRGLAGALDWMPSAGRQARRLSGGTRQKLNLVMAGLGEPDVLLLDEPYQGFDQGSYLDFWRQVWRWRDLGKAVVIVTHLLAQADRADIVLDLTPRGEAVA